MLKRAEAGVLSVAYIENGPSNGLPVLLLHGFPYDVHSFDEVVPFLVSAGCRVIIPYLRGYGPTRFLSANTPRSGQQAVLAHDLLALMDALTIADTVLAEYDWGGRAACIVAALWPERARGLVSAGGYNIQDISGSIKPQTPENEFRYWYQYYFHSERGRAGWFKIAGTFAGCCGGCGLLPGISMKRPTRRPLPPSTTRILSKWLSIPTGIDFRSYLGTLRLRKRSKG